MLAVLTEQVSSEKHAVLLERGRHVVFERLHAYSGASLPDICTPQLAWDALRKAMAEEKTPVDTYYFSVQELRLLLAVQAVLVEIYTFVPSRPGSNALVLVQAPDYFQHVQVVERVKLVLDLRDDPTHHHGGHYSRLWSQEEWDQQAAWSGPDGDSSDASESDDDGSSSDGSSSCTDDDKDLAESGAPLWPCKHEASEADEKKVGETAADSGAPLWPCNQEVSKADEKKGGREYAGA